MCIVVEISVIGWSLYAGERDGVRGEDHQHAGFVNGAVWRGQIVRFSDSAEPARRSGLITQSVAT